MRDASLPETALISCQYTRDDGALAHVPDRAVRDTVVVPASQRACEPPVLATGGSSGINSARSLNRGASHSGGKSIVLATTATASDCYLHGNLPETSRFPGKAHLRVAVLAVVLLQLGSLAARIDVQLREYVRMVLGPAC